jgi:hypothetical protein
MPMQGLFSTFPTGAAGCALLMMRIALGVLLLDLARWPLGGPASDWLALAPWLIAMAMWVGFLTPLAALLSTLFVLRAWLSGDSAMGVFAACLMLEAVALSLLGPGAFSLDARLFGRRRIIFSQRHGPDGE